MLLQFQEVCKTYHGGDDPVPALRNVSFEIEAGRFLAIRGPSGCGKSTLLLTAGTLLSPDSGEVIMAGERPYQLPGDRRATFRGQRIGFVFQQFHLVPYLSVLENILMPTLALSGTPDAVDAGVARRRAGDLLQQFGLADRAGHTPARLSSGERQRCALARALLNEPQLLLADEPTGNLDAENSEIVLQAMKDFVRTGGAVLLVTHDERAATAADDTLWMTAGQINPLPAVVS